MDNSKQPSNKYYMFEAIYMSGGKAFIFDTDTNGKTAKAELEQRGTLSSFERVAFIITDGSNFNGGSE